jgi:hypothetical protein
MALQRHWQAAKQGHNTDFASAALLTSGAYQRQQGYDAENQGLDFNRLTNSYQGDMAGFDSQEAGIRGGYEDDTGAILANYIAGIAADPSKTPQPAQPVIAAAPARQPVAAKPKPKAKPKARVKRTVGRIHPTNKVIGLKFAKKGKR